MCMCVQRESKTETREWMYCMCKKIVRQCARVKVIASKAEMKSRFVRTSSRSMLIIKSYEKGAGGRRGAEETQWSQWKLKESENKKGREGGEHIHQWLWLAGAGGCWGGQTEGLIKRKISLFNLETLLVAKLARLWPTAWLVLWSGANRFIFSAQSPLSLCVGCKVDYSLEKGFCHHAVGAPTTGSNHPAALTVPASSECSAYDINMPLQTNSPVMQSLFTRLWRIVIAWHYLFHDSVNNVYVLYSKEFARTMKCTIFFS